MQQKKVSLLPFLLLIKYSFFCVSIVFVSVLFVHFMSTHVSVCPQLSFALISHLGDSC